MTNDIHSYFNFHKQASYCSLTSWV